VKDAEKAKKARCEAYHLDFGTTRGQVHKFYYNQGFASTSYHFSEPLSDGG
jgi:hypothetical protein